VDRDRVRYSTAVNERSVARGVLASISAVLGAPPLVVAAVFVEHVASYDGMCAPLHLRPYACGWAEYMRVFVDFSSVCRLLFFSALALSAAVSLVAVAWLGAAGVWLARRLSSRARHSEAGRR
jgi:hypothetical protein